MRFSKGKARSYQLSMAVVCTLLASGGFVSAGYAGTSAADAAAAQGAQALIRTSDKFEEASPAGFDSFAAQGLGVNISFAKTLILAKKPAAPLRFDLTDPNGNTPHLARSVNAMRGDIPEVSAELISQVRKDILAAAFQGLGHPYVWGGTSFDHGWDCSGFVQWAYAQAGVGLPRTEQWLPMVETSNPQPGDLVVQNPDGPNHWSHIGLYIGNGKMISALNPSVGTFIHAPADVSSSSAYFTMPAFAAADEKAAKEAKEKKGKLSAAGSTDKTSAAKPSAKPSTTTGTSRPGTTAPGTTGPGATTPGTTGPGTATPVTAGPGTTPPAVVDPPVTTDPATTPPVVTDPPVTTGPAEPETVEPIAPEAPASTESGIQVPVGASTPSALTTLPGLESGAP
ncbi:cell wall-associated NlpC family hydrolase [Arthrobacter sp. UYCu511]